MRRIVVLGLAVADTVQLLMASSLESASEFFNQTNFNSSSPLTDVAFTSGTGTFTAPAIGQSSSDGYNAGGSQDFDVQVTFETSQLLDDSMPSTPRCLRLPARGLPQTPSTSALLTTRHCGPRLTCRALRVSGTATAALGSAIETAPRLDGGSGSCGGTSVPDSGSTVALLASRDGGCRLPQAPPHLSSRTILLLKGGLSFSPLFFVVAITNPAPSMAAERVADWPRE